MSSAATSLSASATAAYAGAGAAAGAGADGVPAQDPAEVMVYWLDVALLSAVGVFFIAALPRAIGRFSSVSEWTRGLVLRGGNLVAPAAAEWPRRQNAEATLNGSASDLSHTLANHNTYAGPGGNKEWDANMDSHDTSPPTHVRALSTVLHPISLLSSHSLSPTKTFGKLAIMALYLGAVIFVMFFNGGNFLADSQPMGYIAVSQIPVAVALGTKNNVVGMLVGMGYERLNFLHRWVGIVTFVTANLHAVGYIYKWAIKESLSEELSAPYIVSGIIGLIGIGFLFFASFGFIRRRVYTLFLAAHIVGIVLFFVGICYHEDACKKYVLLGVAIYALDHFLRLVKTRVATARVSAVPELELTRVELPTLAAGWRAGQHVRIRVLSAEMGWLGWAVAHPFTVASASESASGRGLVLMCKKAGGWTNRLYAAAGRAGRYASEDGLGVQRELKVVVEGPYGGLGNMVMASYSSVLLVAGGSGVTFALSQAEELVQAICSGRSAVRFIEVVWVTQDKASLTPLIPTFAALIDAVAPIPHAILKVAVYYSRAPAPTHAELKDMGMAAADAPLDAHIATLAPSLALSAGRPALARTLDAIAQRTRAFPRATGVAVGVCGPLGLVEEVRRTARGVRGDLRSACGGVEVHEEVFGW